MTRERCNIIHICPSCENYFLAKKICYLFLSFVVLGSNPHTLDELRTQELARERDERSRERKRETNISW